MPQTYYLQQQQQNFTYKDDNSNGNNNNYQQQLLLQPQYQQQKSYLQSAVDTADGMSKTTVFLPDGRFVADAGNVAQPSTSSIVTAASSSAARIFVGSPPLPPSLASTEASRHVVVPAQYPGHHRDKLDLIRDSLKPFEQSNHAGGDVPYDYYSDDEDDDVDGVGTALSTRGALDPGGEPPKEIQRMMIHALTQVGYDRESAYYALKLVNFNSVMDAAKVLFNIKQNLQCNHKDVFQQQQIYPSQHMYSQQQQHSAQYNTPTVMGHGNVAPSTSVSYANGASPTSPTPTISSSTLSSNGRAALSRYGVMPSDSATTTTTTTISLESGGNTVFGSKLYINPMAQQQYRKSNLTTNSPALTTPTTASPLLLHKQQQQQQAKPSADNSTNSNNNSGYLRYDYDSSRSSISPVTETLTAMRTPSPQQPQQQQKRKPRLAQGKPYPYSHTQPPHTVLRHSNSFDPADHLAVNAPSSYKYQQQQAQEKQQRQQLREDTIPRTVVRIERNASERIQPASATSVGPKYAFGDSCACSEMSLDGIDTAQQGVAQLNLRAVNDAPAPTATVTGTRKAATEFSADTPNIRTIHVDPEAIVYIAKKEIVNPPAYDNYLDQVAISGANAVIPVLLSETSPASQVTRAAPSASEATPQQQRCISPLPESVARRLRANAYDSCVRPCKAAMFRFFMEQHIEKLIQQYRERNQRAIQLTKEMELAKLAETMQEQMIRLLRQKESKYIRLKRQKMNKNMFDMIRHIGVGAFGKVTLVRKKDTGQIYAMKTLSKEDVIQKQQAAHVKAERDILAEANSNWIVKLFFSFQDARNLYFIMEYVPGGDMMQLLINKGVFSERLARFYVAELTCAIEYVHSLGFIHRDIKPDNILIDQKGHIKLTDFGLCTGLRWTHDKRHYVIYDDDVPSLAGATQHYREDSFTLPPHLANARGKVKLLEHRHHQRRNQAHSVVGTGNYMAPEVIKKTGHTQLCDWWSVGVILYEMVYGRPPFMSHNENPAETQYMIVNWRRFLDLENAMGARLSRHCVDIIARLCCDEEMRLGRVGAREIKAHSWFRGINFGELRSQPAEYVPTVTHAEDTSNFDTFEVNAEELFMTLNGGSGRGATAALAKANGNNTASAGQPYNPAFFDFTFRHFFASDGAHGAMENGTAFGRTHPPQQRPSLAPLIEAAAAQQQQQQKQEHQQKKQKEKSTAMAKDKNVRQLHDNGDAYGKTTENNNRTTINISASGEHGARAPPSAKRVPAPTTPYRHHASYAVISGGEDGTTRKELK